MTARNKDKENTAEALKMNISVLVPDISREAALYRVQQLSRAKVLEPAKLERLTQDGRILPVQVTATALVNEWSQSLSL